MRSLGWADYLTVQMDVNRKVLVASYWVYGLQFSFLTFFQMTIELDDHCLRLKAVHE